MLRLELLSTPRLLLVPASPEQLRALIRRDYVLAEWPDHSEAREGLPRHLAAIEADPLQRLWRIRFVVEKASNTLIGSVNLKGPPSPSGEVEIGWGIVAAARRRGFAIEASGAVVDWVFATNRVRRVVATVPETNVPSQRVAARLGIDQVLGGVRSLIFNFLPHVEN